jgi:hypothetical protein
MDPLHPPTIPSPSPFPQQSPLPPLRSPSLSLHPPPFPPSSSSSSLLTSTPSKVRAYTVHTSASAYLAFIVITAANPAPSPSPPPPRPHPGVSWGLPTGAVTLNPTGPPSNIHHLHPEDCLAGESRRNSPINLLLILQRKGRGRKGGGRCRQPPRRSRNNFLCFEKRHSKGRRRRDQQLLSRACRCWLTADPEERSGLTDWPVSSYLSLSRTRSPPL